MLFNVLAYGFDVLHELSSDPEINDSDHGPSCHGWCDLSVASLRHIGFCTAWQAHALAGADFVLFPSPYGSVVMPREENMAIKHALLTQDLRKDYTYQRSCLMYN